MSNENGPSRSGRAGHWAVQWVAVALGGHPDTRINDTTRRGVMMMAMVLNLLLAAFMGVLIPMAMVLATGATPILMVMEFLIV